MRHHTIKLWACRVLKKAREAEILHVWNYVTVEWYCTKPYSRLLDCYTYKYSLAVVRFQRLVVFYSPVKTATIFNHISIQPKHLLIHHTRTQCVYQKIKKLIDHDVSSPFGSGADQLCSLWATMWTFESFSNLYTRTGPAWSIRSGKWNRCMHLVCWLNI